MAVSVGKASRRFWTGYKSSEGEPRSTVASDKYSGGLSGVHPQLEREFWTLSSAEKCIVQFTPDGIRFVSLSGIISPRAVRIKETLACRKRCWLSCAMSIHSNSLRQLQTMLCLSWLFHVSIILSKSLPHSSFVRLRHRLRSRRRGPERSPH